MPGKIYHISDPHLTDILVPQRCCQNILFHCQIPSLQEFFHAPIVVDPDPGTAGHPTMEIDRHGGDGRMGMCPLDLNAKQTVSPPVPAAPSPSELMASFSSRSRAASSGSWFTSSQRRVLIAFRLNLLQISICPPMPMPIPKGGHGFPPALIAVSRIKRFIPVRFFPQLGRGHDLKRVAQLQRRSL